MGYRGKPRLGYWEWQAHDLDSAIQYDPSRAIKSAPLPTLTAPLPADFHVGAATTKPG